MKRVTAALITNGDRILITQRSLTDKMAGKWEFPGGKIGPGETIFSGLIFQN
jgi:8-oxo-dGTP diphosphatase